jgi:sialate O-acetylesterase
MNKKILTFLVFLISINSFSQVSLPAIFSDNMVLQRETNVPVWGTAVPNSLVSVSLTSEMSGLTAANPLSNKGSEGLTHTAVKFTLAKQSCRADAGGKWMLYLPPMKASEGPWCLEIENESHTKIFNNVAIGDVWLASGQSNMDFSVKNSEHARDEITAKQFPNIRFFAVNNALSTTPKADVEGGPWLKCDSSAVKNFSAVAYYFGKEIEKDQHVTIGLIKDTWSGTACEAWASQDMLRTMPDMKKRIDDFIQTGVTNDVISSRTKISSLSWSLASTAFDGLKSKVHLPDYDDNQWKTMTVPQAIEQTELGQYDGVIWFRKSLELDQKYKGKDLLLSFGQLDIAAHVYFNGELIGSTEMDFDQYRSFRVPAKYVKVGNDVVVIRLLDMWGKGGLLGPSDSMFLTTNNGKANKMTLSGNWKYNANLEQAFVKDDGYNKIPGLIYNAKIAPLIPYSLKGFIWYQGEGNAHRAKEYATLFPMLIQDWRCRWKQGNLPFLFVQLPGYSSNQYQEKDQWAELREAQLHTLSYPNTGMAVTIDLVKPNNLHPHNKKEVGERLALVARKVAYHESIQASGPMYESMKVEGTSIRVQFTEVGGGLCAKDGAVLKGFAIAGEDMKFYQATATIDGNTVVVTSPEVKVPVAVRYGWENKPNCNLMNKDGLPASPFRASPQPSPKERE